MPVDGSGAAIQMFFTSARIPKNAHYAKGTLTQPGTAAGKPKKGKANAGPLRNADATRTGTLESAASIAAPESAPQLNADSKRTIVSARRRSPRMARPVPIDLNQALDKLRDGLLLTKAEMRAIERHEIRQGALAARKAAEMQATQRWTQKLREEAEKRGIESLSIVADRLQHSPTPDTPRSMAEHAVKAATEEVERLEQEIMQPPPPMSKGAEREQQMIAQAIEKMKDGLLLTRAEMRALELYEATEAAEMKAKKEIQKIKNRVLSGVGGPRAMRARRAETQHAEDVKKQDEVDAKKQQKLEQRLAEEEAMRSDIEENLRAEAEAQDAIVSAEIEKIRKEAEAAAAVQRAEDEKRRAEEEARAKIAKIEAERAEREAKAAEVEAAAEALAMAHAAKANAPILAAREAEEKLKAEIEAKKASKKPRVPSRSDLSNSASPDSSRAASPPLTARSTTTPRSPMVSARAMNKSPPVSARGGTPRGPSPRK